VSGKASAGSTPWLSPLLPRVDHLETHCFAAHLGERPVRRAASTTYNLGSATPYDQGSGADRASRQSERTERTGVGVVYEQ
jgi:hypothetical protein